MSNSILELPNVLELKVIRLALNGDEPWKQELKKQLPYLKVVSRAILPTGFFTDFAFDEKVSSIEMSTESPVFTDNINFFPTESYPPSVIARLENDLEAMISFTVWVDGDGLISQLEVSSMTGHILPSDIFSGYCNFQDNNGNPIIELCR